MSKAIKKKLVPRLRFPEFRTAAEWGSTSLNEASNPIEERVGERKLTPVSISAGIGFVRQSEKFGRDISGNQYQLYTLVRDGDFVYNKGNSLKFPQGCVYQLQGWGEVAAPNVFISFRLKQGYSDKFFQYCFEKNIHGTQLRKHITSGARSNGLLNISKETFYSVRIPTPALPEQQKIAACLESLDALIAFEKERLEALKAFKKGLMQRLFPREGERVPRLRFPGFEGEWSPIILGDLCQILNGLRVPIAKSQRRPGPYPYYGASGIVDHISDYRFQERLILIGEDGAKWGSFEKTAFIADGKYWVNNHAHVLKPIDVSDSFLVNYLIMLDLSPHVTGKAPPKLTLGKLKHIPVPLPASKLEQQRASEALDTVGALILEQGRKIRELDNHKQGLMRAMFPMAEGDRYDAE